jgi:mercuric ion transport protein
MTPRTLFGIGLAGTGVAALCCFTPALAVLFGALGLTASLAWADVVLLPALVLFAGVTLFAAMRMRAARTDATTCCAASEADGPASGYGERRT